MANETNDDELDIRHTREAREKKALQLDEIEEGDDETLFFFECPVCGKILEQGSDEHIYSPVGEYHIEHLSEGELEYARERRDEEERQWNLIARKEKQARMDRARFGDAAGKHGAPPDAPMESAMYGLGRSLDEEDGADQ